MNGITMSRNWMNRNTKTPSTASTARMRHDQAPAMRMAGVSDRSTVSSVVSSREGVATPQV